MLAGTTDPFLSQVGILQRVEACLEHEFECDDGTYWNQVAWDDEFNRRLFLEELGFERWRVIKFHESGTEIRRLSEGVPRLVSDVPELFHRFIRRGLEYRETDVFDKRTQRCRVVIVPNAFSRRLSIQVTMSTEALGPGRCKCITYMNVVATMFVSLGGTSAYGIGAVVESEVIDQLRHGFDRRACFTNRFLRERGLCERAVATP